MLESDGRPIGLSWRYSREEIIADGVIHVIGLTLGVVGAIVLTVLVANSPRAVQVASAAIYMTGLLAVLSFSAAYNLWPISRWKWRLRRFDHSAIYLLIASTYTPFLLHMERGPLTIGLLIAIWTITIAGIAVKFVLPGRFDRVALVTYLLLGWSGVIVYDAMWTLPHTSLVLLVMGGAFYCGGVVFHLWESLRYQNAVWHGFVLAAAVCHYFAVVETVAFAAG